MPQRPVQRHNNFIEVIIHTAKCDHCDQHNKDKIYRCRDCGQQICTPCVRSSDNVDGQHIIDATSNITPASPIIRGRGGNKKRDRKVSDGFIERAKTAASSGLVPSRKVKRWQEEARMKPSKKAKLAPIVISDEEEMDFEVQRAPEKVAPKLKKELTEPYEAEESDDDLEVMQLPVQKRQRTEEVPRSGNSTTTIKSRNPGLGSYHVPTSSKDESFSSRNHHISKRHPQLKRSVPLSKPDFNDNSPFPVSAAPPASSERYGFLTPPAQIHASRQSKHDRRSASDNVFQNTEEDIEAAETLTMLSRSGSSQSCSPHDSGASDRQRQQRSELSSPSPLQLSTSGINVLEMPRVTDRGRRNAIGPVTPDNRSHGGRTHMRTPRDISGFDIQRYRDIEMSPTSAKQARSSHKSGGNVPTFKQAPKNPPMGQPMRRGITTIAAASAHLRETKPTHGVMTDADYDNESEKPRRNMVFDEDYDEEAETETDMR